MLLLDFLLSWDTYFQLANNQSLILKTVVPVHKSRLYDRAAKNLNQVESFSAILTGDF